jgi:hypothetical protein
MFSRAAAAWRARAVPPYIAFRVDCEPTFLASQCAPGADVDFVLRTIDGRTYAQSVPPAGEAPRTLARGVFITGPASTPLGFYQRLGTTPGPVAPPPNLAPDPLGLATIASVTATAHVYDVSFGGVESIDGRDCYRLDLRPAGDPVLYPLRTLWVEPGSWQIVQLDYERPVPPGVRADALRVRYRFNTVGEPSYWTIVRIDAFLSQTKGSLPAVDQLSEELRDISFPAIVPEADFTP